jgi:hypothetical protein
MTDTGRPRTASIMKSRWRLTAVLRSHAAGVVSAWSMNRSSAALGTRFW